jgi:hypothetical protein
VEYGFEFSVEPPLVTVTATGEGDAATIIRLNRELAADSRFRPGMPILTDLTGLDTRALTGSQMSEVGRSYRRFLEEADGSPIAIVVSNPATFGVVRMGESYAGGPDPDLHRIFYSLVEATSWLLAREAAA